MKFLFRGGKKTLTLEEITELLSQLRLPTGLVFTPTNLQNEKKKFLNSDTYEPQFQYRLIKNKNAEILKSLSSVEEVSNIDPRLSDFYVKLIEEKKESNDLLHAVGNNDLVTDISLERFKRPSVKLFRNASRVLRGNVKSYNVVDGSKIKKDVMLGYDEFVDVFNAVFKELGLNDWSVKSSINIPKNAAKVGVKRKEVLVDKDIKRSRFKIKKTIVHEIGTHVLRAHNGALTGYEALSKANLPLYLDVEEGLATWNESNVGLLTEKILKNKAAFVWAVYLGEELTFRQLYNSLLGIITPNSAWDITYRVKRGLSDTSYPGIYAKDVVYFRGFRKVKQKLEKDPSLFETLYAGKIDFDQCKWVEDGLLPRPAIKPLKKEEWLTLFEKIGI